MNSPTKNAESPPTAFDRSINVKLLRVGIAGAGLMGRWHARAAENAGGEIVAVADYDAKRAARLSAEFQRAQSFGGAAEMLEKKSLDVLHICTPTETHVSVAELAAEAGISLFIEKPLAPTADETIRIYQAAAKQSAIVCPAHQFAFQSGVRQAENFVPRVGRIIHLQATICSAGGGENSADGQANQVAADILPHPLSLFQKFLNDCLPEENWTVFRPQAGEIRVFGQAGEISLSIFISMNARPTQNSFEIFGAGGTIRLDCFHGFAYFEPGRVSKTQKILRPFDSSARRFSAASLNLMQRAFQNETAYPGLRRLVKNFYRAIREKGEPPITPAEAINVARVRDLLIRRGVNGRLKDVVR